MSPKTGWAFGLSVLGLVVALGAGAVIDVPVVVAFALGVLGAAAALAKGVSDDDWAAVAVAGVLLFVTVLLAMSSAVGTITGKITTENERAENAQSRKSLTERVTELEKQLSGATPTTSSEPQPPSGG